MSELDNTVGNNQLADIAAAQAPQPPPVAPASAPMDPAAFRQAVLSPTDQKDLRDLQQYRDGLTADGKPAVDPSRVAVDAQKDMRHLSDSKAFRAAALAPPQPPSAVFSNPGPAPTAPVLNTPQQNAAPSLMAAPNREPGIGPGNMLPSGAPSAPKPAGAGAAAQGPIVFAKPPTPQAPPNYDQSFGPRVGSANGGPTVIPAHTIQTQDPKLAAQLQAQMGREAQDTVLKSNLEAQANDKVAGAQGELVAVGTDRAAAMQAATDHQQAQLDPLEQHQIQLAQERAAMRMTNPDKRGTGQKIGDAIAAGLSAAGMGLLHQGGPNPVLERIHQDIDREVDRQKEEFARKGAALNDAGNIYAQVYKRTGDANAAADAARQVQYGAVKDHIQQLTTASGSPVMKANGVLLADKIQEGATEKALAGTQRVQAATVGGTSQADIDKRARDIINESAKTGPAMDPANAYRRASLEITHRDPFPNAGPLASYGKSAAGAGTFTPDMIPSLGGASTAYDPTRLFQGTEAHANVAKQDLYNASADTFVKNNLGLRGEAADRALKSVRVGAGDSAATIKEQQENFRKLALMHPGPANKPAGEQEPGP